MKIQGHAFVITGGASGLGEGTARLIVAKGGNVPRAGLWWWSFVIFHDFPWVRYAHDFSLLRLRCIQVEDRANHWR